MLPRYFGGNCDGRPPCHQCPPGNCNCGGPCCGCYMEDNERNYMPMEPPMQSCQMQPQQPCGIPLPGQIQQELQSMSMSHAQHAAVMAMQQQQQQQMQLQQQQQQHQQAQQMQYQGPNLQSGSANCNCSLNSVNSPYRFVPDVQTLPGNPICPMRDGMGLPCMPCQPPQIKPDLTGPTLCRPRCSKFC